MFPALFACHRGCTPRYRRYFSQNQTAFLTLATHLRKPWLSDDNAKIVVLNALREVRKQHPFVHLGHVLLNDHLHLLIRPADATGIPQLISSFKLNVLARMRNNCADGRLWQPRHHDHIVRDSDDFARHLDYLHFNPVKHGLVENASDWRWSSLTAWQARGVYSADWGTQIPERIRGMRE